MLLVGIILGLIAGFLLGGRIDRLLDVRLRSIGLIFAAVVLRFGTELAIRNRAPLADELRLPLFALAFSLLVYGLWLNRDRPGLLVAGAGSLANGIAIVANGGWMPVWRPSLELAGFTPDALVVSFHRLLPETFGLEFLLRAGPFADIIPVPLPFITNVASVGDIFISIGLGWFVFSTMLQGSPVDEDRLSAALGTAGPVEAAVSTPQAGVLTPSERSGPFGGLRLRRPVASTLSGTGVHPETGLAASGAYADTLELDRPVMLGGTAPGPTGPASAIPVPQALQQEAVAVPPIVARIGRHPYVRLALDARFSAFWLGQTISLFGDRLHQIALGVLVLNVTGSPLATGLAFLSATLPNILLGPLAGTLVDRWDQKQVLVVSDLLRAALVLMLPIAAAQDVRFVYPIAFAITTVSIFFRPAKAAVLPRLVSRDDFMAASSATWTGEALADVLGYPLAGLFVAFLGASLPLAFFVDAASYLISALLILGLAIPPVVHRAAPAVGGALRRLAAELRDGWRFMRGEPALFQNTLVSAIAQASIGATIALTVVYAKVALEQSTIPYPQNFSALEAVLGVGNLVGGLAIGAIGARFQRGHLIAFGFMAMGAATIVMGLTSNVLLALVAVGVAGVANLVFIIPTQALFAERTPPDLMGRVVSFRQTLVFGSLTAAMAVSGILAEAIPVGVVIALFGALTVVGGVLALLLPAVRES